MRTVLTRLARQSPSMVVALLALLVAMGGTAVAAGNLITGKQIKNSSVTGADIKNKSLTSADIRGQLRGPRGLQGAAGAPGAKGDKGDKGDKGADFTIATTLQPGQTETGVFGAWALASSGAGYMADSVDFRIPLAADLPDNRDVFVPAGTATALHCPGIGQAEAGWLCLYEVSKGNSTFSNAFDPTDGLNGISKYGFNVYYTFPAAGSAWSYGQWAVTAPAATASVSARPSAETQNP